MRILLSSDLVERGCSTLEEGGKEETGGCTPQFSIFSNVPGIYSRMGVVPHLVPPRL